LRGDGMDIKDGSILIDTLIKKNDKYGNSFFETEKLLKILFPSGISLNNYSDILAIARITDKLFRIVNTTDEMVREDAWFDICGYAMLQWLKKKDVDRNYEVEL